MNIEEEIFKRATINYEKLKEYGFIKEKNTYKYSETFLDETFKAVIIIDENEKISGKVYDLDLNEEYTNIRVENQTGEFVNKVRESYKEILKRIRRNCFQEKYFISNQANRITKYIKDKYKNEPEFLWSKFPGYGVFRNSNNDKWYGIIMNLDLSKLEKGTGEVEILNVKLEENKVSNLLEKKGFYKAYHMNKKDWISIILNDTLEDEEIIKLLNESYNLINESEEWIVPVNPNYFDIENCFQDKKEILWKQSSNIHIGDIIYLYVGNPLSKVLYKCRVIEVDIPYNYKDNNLQISKVMKIELIKRYNHDKYSFSYLNNIGIKAIRGPRKISKEISNKLN